MFAGIYGRGPGGALVKTNEEYSIFAFRDGAVPDIAFTL
jgi:hypothetical protein